ncbi:MAG: putative sugar nucleotidyl transferase [Bacteroidales bacterium]|nr:putative sugar nucleotidyl transferase [Bacteroidales bacterium]
MNIILFDGRGRNDLLPFTFTRPVAEIRVGILTICEKWEKLLSVSYSYLTEAYLQEKFPLNDCVDNLFVNGNILPTAEFVIAIQSLQLGECLTLENETIAFRGSLEDFQSGKFAVQIEFEKSLLRIQKVYDIFMLNGAAMEVDFRLLTKGRKSAELSSTVQLIGETHFPDGTPKLFVEEGVSVECATINLKNGPVYLGKDVEIMEGVHIRAPFAACEHAVVNMGAKIYGATTIGPYCKVGGELNNVVMFGYSNKAHDGFLGNAVIGEWCNIGAGTEASNLKNDYSEVKLWSYETRRFQKTGLQFCGLIMGDYSKAGINSMFNTATTIGVGCNVYGSDFPRVYIPSFQEGGTSGFKPVIMRNFFATLEKVKARRGLTLSEVDRDICEKIAEFGE